MITRLRYIFWTGCLTILLITGCEQSPPATPSSSGLQPTKDKVKLEKILKTAEISDLDFFIEEASDIINNQPPREANQALRYLARIHDPKVSAAIISLLHKHSRKLPRKLPPLAEIQAMEQAGRTHPELWMDRWFVDYGKTSNAAVCLIHLGYPEGIDAAEKAYADLASAWGDTEASQPLLKALRSEMDNAHADSKTGAVPWKQRPVSVQ